MEPVLELVRLETGPQGTFGILKLQAKVFCATLEPPDHANRVSRSSIPPQMYEIEAHYSQKFKNTWLVKDVPERTHILFHAGNVAADTSGCIILGQYIDKLRGDRAVLNSGKTFKHFLNSMQGYSIGILIVKEVY